jgi:hypothetical protein
MNFSSSFYLRAFVGQKWGVAEKGAVGPVAEATRIPSGREASACPAEPLVKRRVVRLSRMLQGLH